MLDGGRDGLLFRRPRTHVCPLDIVGIIRDIVGLAGGRFFVAARDPCVVSTLLRRLGSRITVCFISVGSKGAAMWHTVRSRVRRVCRDNISLFILMRAWLGWKTIFAAPRAPSPRRGGSDPSTSSGPSILR